MADDFAVPGSTDGIDWKELNGALLVIEPTEIVRDVKTMHGESDAIRADVYVLDGDQAGGAFPDVLVFPRKLRASLSSRLGQRVLGRLGQGAKQPGKNPPWILSPETTAADNKIAHAWLAERRAAERKASDAPF